MKTTNVELQNMENVCRREEKKYDHYENITGRVTKRRDTTAYHETHRGPVASLSRDTIAI